MTTPSEMPREPQRTRTTFTRSLVAGVSAVALLAGVGLTQFAQAVPQQPTEQVQPQRYGLPDFSPLVERVKPAVLSVQVESNPAMRTAADDNDDDDQQSPGDNPFKGTPFERFFGPNGGNGPHGFQGPHGGQGPAQVQKSLGSGFFISADGYAVTNNHVIDGATKIEVVTDAGKTYRAKLVGADPKTDLALIKVEGDEFPFVKMAQTMPKIGEWVLAVGNPYGLGGTVTAGIVSAENRDIGSGPYDDFIQIDAAVNRGNSGGPTFNLNGEVIGVNTAIFSPSGGSVGIAFDIPTTTVQSVIPVLRDKGRLDRAWLGVQIQPITADIAQSIGLADAKGAIITAPQPDGPAAKAGLKTGDVILKVDGVIIADARDLARVIGRMAPDTKADLVVVRDGHEKTMRITLGMMDEPKQKRAQVEQTGDDMGKLGLSVAPASTVPGRGRTGLLVLNVDPAGAAADAGINAGDVILKIGDRDISTAKELRQALSDAKAQGKTKALVLVKSNSGERYVALPAAAA